MHLSRCIFYITLRSVLFISQALTDTKQVNESHHIDVREKGQTASKSSVVLNSTQHTKQTVSLNVTQAVAPSISQNAINASHSQQIISEGGSVTSTAETHSGREHVIEASITKSATNGPVVAHNTTLTKPNTINDIELPPQNQKQSVPKKGVVFPDSETPNESKDKPLINKKLLVSSANITSIASKNTTSISIPKKPLVSESDSDLVDITKDNSSNENFIFINQLDQSLGGKKNKSSDYIVPIVAVILSVPLVAILISLLYKRGTYWWQHRNYKRMDFLIEGMYHN